MFKLLRISFRLALLCAHLTMGVLLALIFLTKPLAILNLYNPKMLIKRWLYVTSYFTGCRITCDIKPLNSPTLLVSNHISWLDILILGGIYELQFLSKEEVKQWPIIGFLTVISGTLLIKRGSGSEGAVNAITSSLNTGNNVGLFPEGTTSSGLNTKAFHSRLLKSAYQAQSSISVVSLSYSSNGTTRDAQMGWEKQGFLQHVIYVLSQKRTTVQINLVTELTEFHQLKRKELAAQCRQLIDDDLQRNHYPCE